MKKTLFLFAAFSLTAYSVNAEELLAHASDKQTPPQAQTSGIPQPANQNNVAGNPAGGTNLDDGRTRIEKSDHFNEQKNAQTQDIGDNLQRNPALAVQQGIIQNNQKQ